LSHAAEGGTGIYACNQVLTVMNSRKRHVNEYKSGDIVEPGDYIDIETGAKIHIHERDELPAGHKDVEYQRRFRKVDSFTSSRLNEQGE
jgi:hypothetical protein